MSVVVARPFASQLCTKICSTFNRTGKKSGFAVSYKCHLPCAISSPRLISSLPRFRFNHQYRFIHASALRHCSSKENANNPEERPGLPDYVRNHVFLSDLPFTFLPNLWKSWRNKIFEFMIRGYFDSSFSIQSFADTAAQVVVKISHLLANEDIKTLEDMDVCSADLISELKENLAKMTTEQKEFIRINAEDIMRSFIYEIGIIMDDQTDEKFVEITFVVHGQHGISGIRQDIHHNSADGMEKLRKASTAVANAMSPFGPHEFVANYRFIRQFRSSSVNDTVASFWVVNKLNHFRPLHYILKSQFEAKQRDS